MKSTGRTYIAVLARIRVWVDGADVTEAAVDIHGEIQVLHGHIRDDDVGDCACTASATVWRCTVFDADPALEVHRRARSLAKSHAGVGWTLDVEVCAIMLVVCIYMKSKGKAYSRW